MSLTPTSPDYILPKIKAETLSSLVKKGVRLSGRGLNDYRDIEIEVNCIPNADGSAHVELGNTQVLVGIKLEVGTPYPDSPNEGTMVVSAEFVPTASPVFEPGPPDENAIELARVIDRSIREIRAIDLSKLVLIPGKKVWNVWIDIYVLDHDGNLIDASSIATMAALLVTKVPKAEVDEEGNVKVYKGEYVGPLPITRKVVTVTAGKLGDVILLDPDLEEESVLDTKLVIAVSDDGRIAGIQKTGMGHLTKDEVLKIVDRALMKGKEILAKIDEAVMKATRESTEEKKPEVAEVSEEEEKEPEQVESEEKEQKENL